MDANHLKIREEYLRRWSQGFPYPATPDIAGSVARRLEREARPASLLRPRLAWGVATLILLLGATLAIPPVRAQVLEWLQVGAIRIILSQPTPTPTPVATHPLAQAGIPTAPSTPRPYPSLADLPGETSLAEAQSRLRFPIPLPAYPADLGEPDRVFLQNLGGQAVLLVWMDPEELERIRLDLLLMGPGAFGEKFAPPVIAETSVNGQPALWTEGPHTLYLGGMYQQVPLVVQANVLIWTEGEVTYRLETDLPLEEAVRIAESLETVQPEGETIATVEPPMTATPSPTYLPLENCPVTQPQNPPFIPPPPYPAEAPYEGEFWYGTEALWTMLRFDGRWWALPYHEHARGGGGYVQKVFWWNEDYDWQAEPIPEFKVTLRRLDGPAPVFESTQATNAYHPEFGSAILTGVEIPTLGCWQVSGSYRGHALSFVVRVEK